MRHGRRAAARRTVTASIATNSGVITRTELHALGHRRRHRGGDQKSGSAKCGRGRKWRWPEAAGGQCDCETPSDTEDGRNQSNTPQQGATSASEIALLKLDTPLDHSL